jgi:hypothetical protein
MIIEAAKQALEALERYAPQHGNPDDMSEAITALRTEIEAAEKQDDSGPIVKGWQLSVSDGHSGRGVYAHMIDYPEEGAVFLMPIEQAEKQEPVAWIEHIAGGVEYSPYHQVATKLPEGVKFDLYTYPPAAQRQPLTEIAEALRRYGLTLVQTTKGYDVMRLGEISAHGIGGKHD